MKLAHASYLVMLTLVPAAVWAKSSSDGAITHVLLGQPLPYSTLHEEIRLLPNGQVRFRTTAPNPQKWNQRYVVGEFSTQADASLYSRLRTTLKAKGSHGGEKGKGTFEKGASMEAFSLTISGAKPQVALRTAGKADPAFDPWQKELSKLKSAARSHPVSAVALSCKRSSGLRCTLSAIGKEPSILPMPGATPYTFYCVNKQDEVSELVTVSKPAKSKRSMELRPGKHYPFVLPESKSCEQGVVLKIGRRDKGGGIFDGASLASGPIATK